MDDCDSHHCNGTNGAIRPSKRSLPYLLVSSGFDKAAASTVSQQLQEAWTSREDHGQIASTLASSRTHLPWRSFAIAWPDSNVEKSWIPQPPQRSSREKRLAFVFSGQGAQYVGMGKELMQFSVFQQSILSMEEDLFELQCPWSLQGELYINGRLSQLTKMSRIVTCKWEGPEDRRSFVRPAAFYMSADWPRGPHVRLWYPTCRCGWPLVRRDRRRVSIL